MSSERREKHVAECLSEIRRAMSFDRYSPQQTDLVIQAALRVLYAEGEIEGFRNARTAYTEEA